MTGFTCNLMEELMFDYIDGEISEADKKQFDAHVLLCENCRKEFQARKNTVSAIADARYNLESSLAAALMPQIKIIQRQNFMKVFGTVVAAAAVFAVVILAYFNPFVTKMNDIAQNLGNENMQLSLDMAYGNIEMNYDIVIEEGIVAEAECASPFVASRAILPTMADYLSQYAPEYIDTTSILYICYTNVTLPEEGAVNVIVEPKFTANIFSNTIDLEIEYSEKYEDSEDKPYIVIIEFNEVN